ncbi:MAG: GlgB N-terminal domain-containing protein, partial [Pirellula sp.]
MHTQIPLSSLSSIIDGVHADPRGVLGPHPIKANGRNAIAVRGYFPGNDQAWLVDHSNQAVRPMRRIHPSGVFEGVMPDCESRTNNLRSTHNNDSANIPNYSIRLANRDGNTIEMTDPYSVPSFVTDFDRYLFNAGKHWKIYEKLGSHIRDVGGQTGVNFAVWAPNAQSVQVVGDFNHWDGRSHAMQKQVPSGIWELFVPAIGDGQKYKYRVRMANGEIVDKTDPFGVAAELPPRTASVVCSLDRHKWEDDEWMHRRKSENQLEKP